MNQTENKPEKFSGRRNFLRNSALAAAGFMIIPRHVLGRGYIAPSDKLNIAAIGVGGKGRVNIANSFNKGTANIVALCDVDDRQSVWARKEFPKAPYYTDFRTLYEKEARNFDAVIISTPDHMHAVQALPAMKMNKHIYLEKPLTHDIAEARLLTDAAKKYRVVTQMGNQGSSGDSTRNIETWISKGIIGEVNRVHVWTNRPTWPQGIATPTGDFPVPEGVDWDLWLGTAPQRAFNPIYIPANWRGWTDYGTGSLGDMGCHFLDVPYRALKLGYPDSVECSVGSVYTGFFQELINPESYPPSSKIHLQFPEREGLPKVEIIWYDGGILPKRPAELLPDEKMGEYDGGMIFEGTKGKLMAGLFGRNPTLLPTVKMKDFKPPAADRPYVKGGEEGHQTQWVEACKKGPGSYTSSPFEAAGPLTETVLMGNLAIRSYHMKSAGKENTNEYEGRKLLLWDGLKMRITNFDAANQFVQRKYRGNWDTVI